MGPNLKGALLALLGFGIFATHDVVVKFLGAFYAPMQIVFFGVLLGFPVITLMLLRDRAGESLVPRHPWWVALRSFGVVISGVSAFYAFSKLPLAQTYAIIFMTPLIITILSIPVLGERVGPHRWSAIVVGLVGVMVVLRPGEAALGLGHLAAFTAAIGSALTSIIARKIGHAERSVVLLLYPMLANIVVMGAALPFVYQPMPLLHFGGLVVIALFGMLAMLCMIGAYRNGEAGVVAPMQYSQILWAAGYGYLFFNETVDFYTLAGAGIIIASGLYILFREGRGGISLNRPVLRTKSRVETGTSPRISAILRRRKAHE